MDDYPDESKASQIVMTLLCVGLMVVGFFLGFSQQLASAASASLAPTPTPRPTQGFLYLGDEAYECHVSGPTSYLCVRLIFAPTVAPTRIPSVTPLTEGTNTSVPRPTFTATAVLTCKDYTVLATVLNVRAKPSLSGTILKTFKKGDTISLSAKPSDTVLAEGVTWILACGTGDPAAWVSKNWIQAK